MEEVNKLGKILIVDDNEEDIFVIIYNQYFPVLHIPGIILSRVKNHP